MAISRLDFLRRDFITRLRSTMILQRVCRGMFGRKRSRRFYMFQELTFYYREKMAIRIQCFQRQYFARRKLDERLQKASERYLLEYRSAIIIQKIYRASSTRHHFRSKRHLWTKAAVEIQRIFRGRRVPRWQEIKMDAITRYVRARSELEHENSLRVRQGYTQSTEMKETSDDELEEPSIGSPGDETLIKHAFGHCYVGRPVRVFWPDTGLYKQGRVGGYDDRVRLWQIQDYDEDDNEWLDLVREQDRVVILEKDWIPFCYCRPTELTQYLEKRRVVEPSNSTWTPQESREQITSELFYCGYVARGILDECYCTQSYGSFIKLREAHLVQKLTVSIAKFKYLHRGIDYNKDLEQFERLLQEVEAFMHTNS